VPESSHAVAASANDICDVAIEKRIFVKCNAEQLDCTAECNLGILLRVNVCTVYQAAGCVGFHLVLIEQVSFLVCFLCVLGNCGSTMYYGVHCFSFATL